MAGYFFLLVRGFSRRTMSFSLGIDICVGRREMKSHFNNSLDFYWSTGENRSDFLLSNKVDLHFNRMNTVDSSRKFGHQSCVQVSWYNVLESV